MATVAQDKPVVANHFMFWNASWDAYVRISDSFWDQPIRFTYDSGRLELMTLSGEHERRARLLGLFVQVLAEELDVDVDGRGSMTFRRVDLDRGMEPDECFWVQNEAAIRGRDQPDLNVDPPPDLGIEVEVSRGILDRLAIYAALKIQEVWRDDGQTVHIMQLQANGKYQEATNSSVFPGLKPHEMARLVQLRMQESNTTLTRMFRAWVRAEIAAGRLTRPAPSPPPQSTPRAASSSGAAGTRRRRAKPK
jgi:Uma2 family endonuclease